MKRLASSGAPTGAERAFVEEIQTLQLASTVCQRSCRILGCCKLDGDLCIVMSLYAGSAAQRLQESRGRLILLAGVCLLLVASRASANMLSSDYMVASVSHCLCAMSATRNSCNPQLRWHCSVSCMENRLGPGRQAENTPCCRSTGTARAGCHGDRSVGSLVTVA